MTIKAILFDMDGVLIEAKEWHYEALNKALSLFGITISKQDHLERFDGLPTRKKLEILSVERGLSHELHAFINTKKQEYTIEMINTYCKPYSTHEFALMSLKAQGYRLALCSNSMRNTVELMMQKSSLKQYLDIMISNEDVFYSKPHPEMYLKAMSYFELQPQECLIVEDNENGIKAAKASGGHLLIVKNIEETNLDNILGRIKEIMLETHQGVQA